MWCDCDVTRCVLLADDYNRVVLEHQEGTPDSDYVNASYVDVSHFQILQRLNITNATIFFFGGVTKVS